MAEARVVRRSVSIGIAIVVIGLAAMLFVRTGDAMLLIVGLVVAGLLALAGTSRREPNEPVSDGRVVALFAIGIAGLALASTIALFFIKTGDAMLLVLGGVALLVAVLVGVRLVRAAHRAP